MDLHQAAMLKHIGIGLEQTVGNPRIDTHEIAVAVEHIDAGLDAEHIGLQLHQRLVAEMSITTKLPSLGLDDAVELACP